MSRALALVGVVCLAGSAHASAMVHVEPDHSEDWIKVTTSQTPPNAAPIYYRDPDYRPFNISEFPILWRWRPLTHNVPLLEFRIGDLLLPVRLNPAECALLEVAVNLAPDGDQFLATITSTAGVRQFATRPIGAPEPSSLALAAIGLLALRRRR